MSDLKPCPFCSSTKLKLEKKSVLAGYNGMEWKVERHTWSVRCNVCKARGGVVSGKVIPNFDFFNRGIGAAMPEWATTDDELKLKAIEAWNRRDYNAETCNPV